jgi:Do/DeqQ family serine protease
MQGRVMSPRKIFASIFGLFAILCSAAPSPGENRETPTNRAEVIYSFAPVVKRAQPAVVNVFASRTDPRPRNPLFDDPVFRHFFGDTGNGRPGGPTAQSLGSGVLVDASGLVVSNFHVIEGMTDVKVVLADRREFDADIVLRDQRTDLAVLRLKGGGSNFPFMDFGDSDSLQVGDLVLAIGNPFGVGQTVTQGIVSALARTQAGISDYGFFIQTDASINPGNSGGALIDMNGRLVGINSAIVTQSGGSVGIGFAIPVNMVKIVVAAAKSGGKIVKRPWFGASLQPVTHDIAETLGLDRPVGALVTDVVAKGPADESGLRHGDVITNIDGIIVEDTESVLFRLATKPLGATASLKVIRDRKPMELGLKLVPAPEIPARDPVKIGGLSPFTGATVINLSPAVAEEFSIVVPQNGVVISDVDEESTAAALNLKKGDVVLSVNDARIESTHDLERATVGRHPYWKLGIVRNGQLFSRIIGG